eukprot:m51a1_g2092 hypothetical protein (140) ;mRNA; r:1531190-1531701
MPPLLVLARTAATLALCCILAEARDRERDRDRDRLLYLPSIQTAEQTPVTLASLQLEQATVVTIPAPSMNTRRRPCRIHVEPDRQWDDRPGPWRPWGAARDHKDRDRDHGRWDPPQHTCGLSDSRCERTRFPKELFDWT